MSQSVLYMSMSLDGYIAGPNDAPGNPGGDGFMRLHEWYGFPSDGEAGPNVQPVRADAPGGRFWAKSMPPARSCQVGGPLSRWITGVAITTGSQSSCPVTDRLIRRSRTIRW